MKLVNNSICIPKIGGGDKSNDIKTDRIPWIDISKGILIMCLVFGHHKLFAMRSGYEDGVTVFIQHSMRFYAAFFMQTFFIITGLCSSFTSQFPKFVWKNIKTLLIPAALLVVLGSYVWDIFSGTRLSIRHFAELMTWVNQGGPWFIMALFWAKILYWPLNKFCNYKKQFVFVTLLYFVGLALNQWDFFPNYMYHRHMLLMMPYLLLGAVLRNYMPIMEKYLSKLAIIGFAVLMLQTLSCWLFGTPFPAHDYNIGISFKSFPIHIVNVLLGTCFIFGLSKVIGKCSFLQTMGKGTLLVYLLDSTVENISLSLCSQLYNQSSIASCILFHGASFALSIAIFYMLIRIIYSTKYLSWIVGKW